MELLDRSRHVVLRYSGGGFAGARVALVSAPDRPAELFAAEGGSLRQLSHVNDSLIQTLRLSPTEDFASPQRRWNRSPQRARAAGRNARRDAAAADPLHPRRAEQSERLRVQRRRELGVATQLVIYPNQHHGLSVPSFLKDRLDRYVAWYDKYLKPPTQVGSGSTP